MVGELFVIDTHQMKNRGVVVLHMTWSVGRSNPVFVGFPVGYPIGYPSPDATAGEDARECVGAMFTTGEKHDEQLLGFARLLHSVWCIVRCLIQLGSQALLSGRADGDSDTTDGCV